MGYTPEYGANRTSGIMKTKELAGKSGLFNLGEVSPINHDLSSGGEHTHIEGSDKYTYQEDVKTGTKKQSRSGRNELAKNMANAANAESEGFEGTQYNTQGHMRSGSKGSIKLFTKKNILEAKTGTRGGGSYGKAVETKATYKKVKARDVRNQLRATGSASITDGVISSGTTQTRTATGSTKRDTDKAAYAAKTETRRSELKNLKARKEGERSRDMLERKQAKEKELVNRRAQRSQREKERENKKTNKK
jgi:hypothetical protein